MPASIDKYLRRREQLRCICGNSRSGLIFRHSDRFELPLRYSLCLRCGHVRNVDPIDRALIGDFYGSSDYRTLYRKSDNASRHFASVGNNPVVSQKLFNYCKSKAGSAGLVVEWGCSGGWNLLPFRDEGWRVVGYDLDSVYVPLGRETYNLDLRVAKSGLPSKSLEEPPDVIILNHVLEHVVDPIEFLTDLRQCCKSSTLVVVGVPLLETMKIWHWKNFFHIAHVHYFSARTFRYCASAGGFDVIDSSPSIGYFTLKMGTSTTSKLGKLSVCWSVWYLLRGFLEPIGRARKNLYKFICAVGLKECYDEFIQSRRGI